MRLELACQFAHRFFVKRLVQRTVCAQALRDFEAQRTRYQRNVLGKEQVVGIRAIDPTDLIDVSKTLCDQQCCLGTAAFKQGIDGNGGAMQEQVTMLQVNAGTVQRVLDTVDQLAVG